MVLVCVVMENVIKFRPNIDNTLDSYLLGCDGVSLGDWIKWCVVWWLNHVVRSLVPEECGTLFGDWVMWCVIWWPNHVVCYLVTESCGESFGDWIMSCVILWLNHVVCHLVTESCCPHHQAWSHVTLRNTHSVTQRHIWANINPLSSTTVRTPDLTQRGWFFQAQVHVIWILEIRFLWLSLDNTWMNSLMSNINTPSM
jgi:hypothetical protein